MKPTLSDIRRDVDAVSEGAHMHGFCGRLYPLCRSITGNGTRETLAMIGERIPLEIVETPSGTAVFDWTVPKEWNIQSAWIKNPQGDAIIDLTMHTLHVLNYSAPIRATLPLSELKAHIFTDPARPDEIPYRTSYFKETWGFCMSHSMLESLPDGDYEICIDSSLTDGSLTYGECVIPGTSSEEVLISAHVCHPSLVNDNLSGIAVAVTLAQQLLQAEGLRYTYRFVFAPGTIGAITWLHNNTERSGRIRHGLILACVGDRMKASYKQSRPGGLIDQAAEHVLRMSGGEYEIKPFSPYGYDERQYGSPGFNLPMGCFMKSPPGTFAEYHCSADNMRLVEPDFLGDSFQKCLDILHVLECNGVYANLNPKCEPMLGKRGLYGSVGGTERKQVELAMLWVLNFSDGEHSLLDIADKADMPFADVYDAAMLLFENGLLARLSPE